MAKIKKKICVMSIVAVICFAIGAACLTLWQPFVQDIIKQEFTLTPNSKSYKIWKKTPIPMYLKIYLYNWTNTIQSLVDPSIKPHFNQMGPYVFREVNQKVNQIWNDENSTITFQQNRTWKFEPSMSNGKLTDYVTIINPIATTTAYTLRHKSKSYKKIIDDVLRGFETIALTKTVGEFLFDGFEDKLLKLAVKLKLTTIPYEKFGWFYARNGSETFDGIFNIFTGKKNLNQVGMLQEWKYKSNSPYYSNTCGKLSGTMGDLWPPLVNNNETVSVFAPDICTSLTLKANGTSEWLGLAGLKYISDADMLDNGTKVASRQCYCKDVDCQPSGTLNVSTCKFDAPAFVSLPHFYLADESYRQNISGMQPNRDDHEFQMIIEPNTGVPIKVRAALQINFLVQPDKDLSFFNKLPKMYAPMLWFTQEVKLTSEYVDQVRLLLLLPTIGYLIFGAMITIGVSLIFFSIFIYIRQKRDDMNETLIPKERDNEETNPTTSAPEEE